MAISQKGVHSFKPPFQANCVYFPGSGSISSSNSAITSFEDKKPFTVSCWVKPDEFAKEAVLVCRGDQYVLALGTDGKPLASRAKMVSPLKANRSIPAGTWSHLTMRFDGQKLELSINAIAAGNTKSTGSASKSTAKLTIAVDDKGKRHFTGRMSDVEIYDFARDDDDVDDTMFEEQAQQPGLVAHYDLTRLPPRDLSGNNLPLTATPEVIYQQVSTGLNTTGSGGPNYVHCPVNAGMAPTPPTTHFTISAWICPTSLQTEGSTEVAAFFTIGDSKQKLWLALSLGRFVLYTATGLFISKCKVDEKRWYFLTIAYDGTGKKLRFYVDGKPDAVYKNATCPFPGNKNPAIRIGQSNETDEFFGFIQSLRIFNDVRTPSEIASWMDKIPIFEDGIYASFDFSFDPPSDDIGHYDVQIKGKAKVAEHVHVVPNTVQALAQFDAFSGSLPFDRDAEFVPLHVSDFENLDFDIDGPDDRYDPELHASNLADELLAEHVEALDLNLNDPRSTHAALLAQITNCSARQRGVRHRFEIEQVGEEHHLVHYFAESRETLVSGASTFEERLLLWKIQVIVTLVTGVLDILFSVGSDAGKGVIKVIRRMMATPELKAAVRVFIAAVNFQEFKSLMTKMYDDGWVKQLILAVLVSLTFWALLRAVAKTASAVLLAWAPYIISIGSLLLEIGKLIWDKPGDKAVPGSQKSGKGAGGKITAKKGAGKGLKGIGKSGKGAKSGAGKSGKIAGKSGLKVKVKSTPLPKNQKREVDLSVYNVGQADCFSVTARQQTGTATPVENHILIDAAKASGWNRVKNVVPSKLDALVVTHMDADHIGGAVKILKNREKDVSELWFNSAYVQFGVTPPVPLNPALVVPSQTFGDAVINTEAIEALRHASDLTYYAQRHHVNILETSDGDGPRVIGFVPFNVIGPSVDNLTRYYQSVETNVKNKTFNAGAGNSVVYNRASIILSAEFLLPGITMLFTGDAHDKAGERDIQDALGITTAMTNTAPSPRKFTFLKVPHHGSDRSEDEEFYKWVFAEYYLVSGKERLPTEDALKWIVQGAKSNGQHNFKIYLTNYSAATVNALKASCPPANFNNYSLWVLKEHELKLTFTIKQDGKIVEPSNVDKKI